MIRMDEKNDEQADKPLEIEEGKNNFFKSLAFNSFQNFNFILNKYGNLQSSFFNMHHILQKLINNSEIYDDFLL